MSATPPVDDKTQRYWRSLEERSGDAETRESLKREFMDDSKPTEVDRRSFLGIMGAAAALAGLAGCSRPISRILPYNKMPEDLVPGVPQQYASVWGWRGAADGLLVTSHEGRPTKIEGNPAHPANRGATNLQAQALILSMYDPDRAATVKHDGVDSTWQKFNGWAAAKNETLRASQGQGLSILAPLGASPSETAMRARIASELPGAKWHTWEAVSRDNEIAGSRLAFGRELRTHVAYDKAAVILSLDSDFMGTDLNMVANSLGFSDGRRITSENDEMNRLYTVESHFSVTGSVADHRVRLAHGRVADFAAALADRLASAHGVTLTGVDSAALAGGSRDWSEGVTQVLHALAKDLDAHRGRCVITVGRTQPAEVHALAHALNRALGSVGPVVRYTAESLDSNLTDSLTDLVQDLNAGSVDTLVMMGGNPLYDRPADMDLAAAVAKAGSVVRLGLYEDESSQGANWFLPEAHPLECWGDATAFDGTVSLQQPLIAPLHHGKSALEVLSVLLGGYFEEDAGHAIVASTWRTAWGSGWSEKRWNRTLHDGLLPGTAAADVQSRIDGASITSAWRARRPAPQATAQALEVVFREDPKLHDGRFANLAWLQEVPDPMTKITWDNPVQMSPATARSLGVATEDLVKVSVDGRELTAAVWVQPGHADNTLSLFLGYGRTAAGRVGTGMGFDTYALRTGAAPDAAYGATVTSTGATYKLATTQHHWDMEDRPLAREATLEHYKEHPDFTEHMEHDPGNVSMYLDREYDFSKGNQWGMTVDLNTCSGCNACVVACQSENNIASVGKDQVLRGREMHWIRIDRYFVGDEDNPHTVQQPLPCQQCENAPCEAVCPVNATAHSDTGLNDMVYNRCIGTRYCANNCPYKVRRFNFYDYNGELSKTEQMGKNPNVTVRMRGVMEKCTFCVQRINRAGIDAKVDGRDLVDGDIVTACQQVCPTRSITFGDINDPESRVSRLKTENRNYAMLAWVNTRPRTSYLSRIRNQNPELEHHS